VSMGEVVGIFSWCSRGVMPRLRFSFVPPSGENPRSPWKGVGGIAHPLKNLGILSPRTPPPQRTKIHSQPAATPSLAWTHHFALTHNYALTHNFAPYRHFAATYDFP
jgi:hypothetical protein